ncbi:TPM domain-containing protein [Streptococcus oricebi]|uniref:TPM domain-containing protein n=1 Tax=Streptococcus oricebi TaxID=1547447 RepID=A0ABS5B5P5_9STRE|nr:TPM domain-containing protein [Streptococcus oricebi]MBP2624159.1 hypothetical protein [Streptococcus oricebi]
MKKKYLPSFQIWLKFGILFFIYLVLSAFTAPERPANGVYDPDNHLSTELVDQIKILNEANSNKESKLQIGVYVVDSLKGETIENVANETARAWNIGYAEDNNGVLIAVSIQDRKSRIETSDSVAAKITDYETYQFLQTARPFFRRGDYSGGVLSIANNLNHQFYGELSQVSTSLDLDDIAMSRAIYEEHSSSHSSESDLSEEFSKLAPGLGILFLFFLFLLGVKSKGSDDDDHHSGGSSWRSSSWSSSSSSSRSRSSSSGWSSKGWSGGGFGGGGSSDSW